MRHKIYVDKKTGRVQYLYADALQRFVSQVARSPTITRVSHVEPDGMGWMVDMGPVSGPTFGPYQTRASALAHEKKWIEQNYLGRGSDDDDSAGADR